VRSCSSRTSFCRGLYSALTFLAFRENGDAAVNGYCRDGRLRENDHLISVDGHLLGDKSSLEDAVHWLQAATGKVTLVVAHKRDSPRLLGYNSISPTSSTQLIDGEFTVSDRLALLLLTCKFSGVFINLKCVVPGGGGTF